jgi:predicted DsbA family dithiol-disulfide isomerase
MEMYISKFGKARMDTMLPQMKETGLKEGINFSYGGYTGNTFDSHRLIWKAKEVGGIELQDKVVESLFKAYFEEEKSMGDLSVLIDCANRVEGMTIDVKEFLEDSNNGKNETLKELEEYRRAYGVTGVPFFIFNDKYSFSGAQPPNEILSVFKKLVLD